VAPGSPFDHEKFQRACGVLEVRGYGVRIGGHVFDSRGYVAGSESARATDLVKALLDPEIAAVLCVRGGYGSGCLLPWLPFSRLGDGKKPFVGFSDATFLHLAFQGILGWTTFHGPNLLDLADSPSTAEDFFQLLQCERDFHFDFKEEQVLIPGTASGKITGGNLTCLAHSMGTPYFPRLQDTILFLEDCNEKLYRLDRCINQLKLGGVFEGLAGLVLGRFTECGKPSEIHDMISRHLRPFGFPVVVELPFGHVAENRILPLGVPFSLSTYEHSLHALASPFSQAP
jgi:muramoyltetrapeptide carboxypeptidase